MDCPAGIEQGFQNAIAGADRALVVTTPEVSSIRDADSIIGLLEQNQIRIEKSLDLACGTGVLCEILHAHEINASGMDLSEGMIAIARERNPKHQ